MDYKCNMCEKILTITHSATEECDRCGMKYDAETKAVPRGSSKATNLGVTGARMPDVQTVD